MTEIRLEAFEALKHGEIDQEIYIYNYMYTNIIMYIYIYTNIIIYILLYGIYNYDQDAWVAVGWKAKFLQVSQGTLVSLKHSIT